MDISNKFSLVDFLAYLFPGIVDTLGLFVLLLLTPLSPLLSTLLTNLMTGILLVVLSYVIGVLLSGIAERAVKAYAVHTKRQWSRKQIPIENLETLVRGAFHTLFGESPGSEPEWSVDHFYVCRSLVFERMPALTSFIQRQGGLRELRMNLLPTITIWSLAGIAWGIWAILNGMIAWGGGLVAVSAGLWVPATKLTINRMNRNEEREVREVLSAFLAGYKSGLFDKSKGPSTG